jgi:predicted ATPase
LVVLTGGPGAGKTAALEVIQRELCPHVVVLPEAASILWRGGFPRRASLPARRAAQRAIVRVQLELQRMALEEDRVALVVCDRGTLDGLAYWPGEPDSYFEELGTTRARELARYAAVIQLRPPSHDGGYRPSDVRTETAAEAAAIDARIEAAWSGHPRHLIVAAHDDFLAKVRATIELVRAELPAACRACHGGAIPGHDAASASPATREPAAG